MLMEVADRSTDIARGRYLATQQRNSITPEKFAERNGSSIFLSRLGGAHDSASRGRRLRVRLAELLAASQHVSENDNRRSALYRYVTNPRDIGENISISCK